MISYCLSVIDNDNDNDDDYYVLKQFCLRLSSMDHYLHYTMEKMSQPGKFTYRQQKRSPSFLLKEFTLCENCKMFTKVESHEIAETWQIVFLTKMAVS